VKWAHEKEIKDEKDLKDIESLYSQDLSKYANEEHKIMITNFEKKKRALLDEKEGAWRLKSREI
jgi:hypothetical protein